MDKRKIKNYHHWSLFFCVKMIYCQLTRLLDLQPLTKRDAFMQNVAIINASNMGGGGG
jgi:hypothetical protein